MFLVTNRVVHPKKSGFAKFGAQPSPKGPREIRMAEVTGRPGNGSVEILPDTLSRAHKVELGGGRAEKLDGLVYDTRRNLLHPA